MKAEFHKTFDKQLAKLPKKQKEKVIEAIALFLDNSLEGKLRSHMLTGEWTGFRSISAGGDLRLHFENIDNDIAYFVAVGTHS
jgi:addiction module RelE/StbE family toxin